MATSNWKMAFIAGASALAALAGGACDGSSERDDALASAAPALVLGHAESGFPQVGELKSTARVGYTCTGTLIAPRVVLTSTGCGDSSPVFKIGTGPDDFAPFIPVEQQIENPARGLMLMVLSRPVRDFAPLEVTPWGMPGPNVDCTVVGFGPSDSVDRKRSTTAHVTGTGASGNLLVNTYPALLTTGDQGAPVVCFGRVYGVAANNGVSPQQPFAGIDRPWIQNQLSSFTGDRPVAAVSWAHDRLDVFVRGLDDAVYQKAWWGGAFRPSLTDYADLGGEIMGTPEAVARGPERIDVFARGRNRQLLHKQILGTGTPTFGGWEDLGGVLVEHPVAVSTDADHVDVFGVGLDGAVWTRGSSDGGRTFRPWVSLGGVAMGPLAVTSWGPGRIDLFAVGMDHALWVKTCDQSCERADGYSAFHSIGGDVDGAPSVVSWAPGRLDVFAVGRDHQLKHLWFWGGWSGVQNMGGDYIGSPSVTSWFHDRLDYFVQARADGSLRHKSWNGWEWEPIGGEDFLAGILTGAPAAVSWGDRRLDIFVLGGDTNLYHKFWANDVGWGPGGSSGYDWLSGIVNM